MLACVPFRWLLFGSLDGHHCHDRRVVDDHPEPRKSSVCSVNDEQFIPMLLLPHCIQGKDSLFARHVFLFGAVNRGEVDGEGGFRGCVLAQRHLREGEHPT